MKWIFALVLLLAMGACRAEESPDELAARIVTSWAKMGNYHVVGIAGVSLPSGALVKLSAADDEVLTVADRSGNDLQDFMLKDVPENVRIWYALHLLSDKMKTAATQEESKDILKMQVRLGRRLQQLAESK